MKSSANTPPEGYGVHAFSLCLLGIASRRVVDLSCQLAKKSLLHYAMIEHDIQKRKIVLIDMYHV